jgi:hypothetical protein
LADPFADVWEAQIVPLLKATPKLMAVTLLRKLQDDFGARSVACGAREVHSVGSLSPFGWAIGSMEEWRCSMKSRRA